MYFSCSVHREVISSHTSAREHNWVSKAVAKPERATRAGPGGMAPQGPQNQLRTALLGFHSEEQSHSQHGHVMEGSPWRCVSSPPRVQLLLASFPHRLQRSRSLCSAALPFLSFPCHFSKKAFPLASSVPRASRAEREAPKRRSPSGVRFSRRVKNGRDALFTALPGCSGMERGGSLGGRAGGKVPFGW